MYSLTSSGKTAFVTIGASSTLDAMEINIRGPKAAVMTLRQDIEHELSPVAMWWGFIYKSKILTFIIMSAVSLILALAVSLYFYQKHKEYIGIVFYSVQFLSFGAMFWLGSMLYPKSTISIGLGTRNYERRKSARAYVFGVVMLGIILGVFVNFLTDWLKNLTE